MLFAILQSLFLQYPLPPFFFQLDTHFLTKIEKKKIQTLLHLLNTSYQSLPKLPCIRKKNYIPADIFMYVYVASFYCPAVWCSKRQVTTILNHHFIHLCIVVNLYCLFAGHIFKRGINGNIAPCHAARMWGKKERKNCWVVQRLSVFFVYQLSLDCTIRMITSIPRPQQGNIPPQEYQDIALTCYYQPFL